jgi:hypothetical protein
MLREIKTITCNNWETLENASTTQPEKGTKDKIKLNRDELSLFHYPIEIIV